MTTEGRRAMIETNKLWELLTGDDAVLRSVGFFPVPDGARPQSVVDAAARALEAVRNGTSEKLAAFPSVGVAGSIG
jgi:hypothetical protein